MPTNKDDPLAHQNIRDRFYGQEDPVAAKMLAKQDQLPALAPPEDEGITSLWLGNMSPEITQEVSGAHRKQSVSFDESVYAAAAVVLGQGTLRSRADKAL